MTELEKAINGEHMGKNIHFKGMAFVNLNCTFLDSNIITIRSKNLSL